MSWIATAILSIVAVEVVVRLPFMPLARRAEATARRALHTMNRPRVSDHWKEKVMLAHAGAMMGCSLRLAGLLILLFAGVGALAWGLDFALPGFLAFLTGLIGLGATVVFATAWAVARPRMLGLFGANARAEADGKGV
ncbi:MAG: hypothetical protein AAF577_01380 [Pseudomonadota bacterium]